MTENNISADAPAVVSSIKRLNAFGIKVALDDFGSGYTSLAHLTKLAISTLKIDRDMTRMINDPTARGVIGAIVGFAKSARLRVIAEGVETAEESEALAKVGCPFQQGFFHGHPVPLHDVLSSARASRV